MESMKVLFIGNSYTEYNSLQKMFASICKHNDLEVETYMLAEGGMSLQFHYYEEATHTVLRETDWDYVVLQEQSVIPSEQPKELFNSVKRFSELLDGRETKLALYSTWSRKFLPHIQKDIDDAYSIASAEFNCELIPIGKAWSIALERYSSINLFADDHSHPSWLGSYLAACVIFMKLVGKKPLIASNTIDLDESVQFLIDIKVSKKLQECAALAVGLGTS